MMFYRRLTPQAGILRIEQEEEEVYADKKENEQRRQFLCTQHQKLVQEREAICKERQRLVNAREESESKMNTWTRRMFRLHFFSVF